MNQPGKCPALRSAKCAAPGSALGVLDTTICVYPKLEWSHDEVWNVTKMNPSYVITDNKRHTLLIKQILPSEGERKSRLAEPPRYRYLECGVSFEWSKRVYFRNAKILCPVISNATAGCGVNCRSMLHELEI